MEEKVKLRVTGIRKDNSRSYFTVNYRGQEYDVKMFRFQAAEKSHEKEIECLAKDDGNGNITLTQDLVPIVNKLYKEGETYPFQVVSAIKNIFVVCDSNGLKFWMTEYSSAPFIGQHVRCKVTTIKNGYHLFLKLEDKPKVQEEENSLFLTFDDLCVWCEIDEKLKEKVYNHLETNETFQEIMNLYNSQDETWILNFVESIEELVLWSDDKKCHLYIPMFKNICLYLLEKSAYLKQIKKEDREDWQRRISNVLRKAEDYELAFSLINENGEQIYIAEQLINLAESEYLYQPERKLRTILCIFNQREELMAENMGRIFEIILGGEKENWQTEPFRTAFVEMLEMFIQAYRNKATRDSGISLIHNIITATAIQLLLVNEDDYVDRRYNRSTLYRLLSYVKRNYSDVLLNASFRCLFHPYQDKLEYDWTHIQHLDHLYLQVCNELTQGGNDRKIQDYAFAGNNIQLLVEQKGVTIMPENRLTKKLENPLPAKLLHWDNLRLLVDSKPSIKIQNQKDITKHQQFWIDIERDLNTVKNQRNTNIKVEPELGRGGYIMKILYANEDNTEFYCKLCDEHVEGEGWINIREIAKYISPMERLLQCFQNEDGQPMYLPAKVIGGPDENGLYRFSMLEEIKHFFFEESDDWGIGTTVSLLVKGESADIFSGKHYVCVADCGLSTRLQYNNAPELAPGDIVDAIIIDRNSLGQFICKYVDESRNHFRTIDAFQNLIYNIHYDSEDFEDEDDETLPEENMSAQYVEEIIGILDRLAVLSKNREETYAYLCIASIMSKMLGKNDLVNYYEQRKSIILMFHDYEKSGKMDEAKLTEFINNVDNELIQSDYMINEAITKFHILNSLKNDTSIDNLLKIRSTTQNEAIRDAADLAISVLLTSRFGLPNVKRQLVDKINEDLGVKAYIAERKNYGIESQTVEFKTSIVYPADNKMQPEPNLQGAEIMKVICGFLNSDEGGTLYLGVSDLGVATGVANDLRHLIRNEDGYGRYVHNLINRDLGTIANQCTLESSWEEDEGYKVYVVKVKPAPELVRYKGAVWIRQDTEKRVLPEEDLESFAAMHRKAYERYQEKNPVSITAATDTSLLATSSQDDSGNASQSVATEGSIYYKIPTSQWRKNAQFDYEPDYAPSPYYLHFLKKEQYKITDEPIYEDTHLSLAIHHDETEGYLVLGYGEHTGNILLVEMSKIMQYELNKRLPRNSHERVIFAAPAKKGDGVLTAWKNTHNELCVRIDDIDTLIEEHHNGDMNDPGTPVHDTKFNELCLCEIVPAEQLVKLNKFRKQGDNLGQKIKPTSKHDISLLQETLKIKLPL